MSTDLNIHLSPEAFTTLQQVAIGAGRTPSEEAKAILEQQLAISNSNRGDGDESCGRIEDFFGTISFGGMTNEEIDAELAREYGKGLDGN